MTPRIFLVAGEPSGDRLGAALMAGITEITGGAEFIGVGGPEMESRGLTSTFDYTELSVMGFAEVVPKLPRLLSLLSLAGRTASESGADAVVTIDSPDFCLRLARRIKRAGLAMPVIHYVAPSLWAWRPGRAAAVARSVDHVLALLPFEPEFLEGKGIASTFVGHPAVATPEVPPNRIAALRSEFGIAEGQPVLAVLPGSRRSEINVLEPVFRQAVRQFLEHRPDYAVIVPAAPSVSELLAARIGGWPPGVHLLCADGCMAREAEIRKLAAFRTADIALAASGTVVLELALTQTPMVAAYDMKWLSRQIVASMLQVDTVNLVNLVVGERVVPELLGSRCRPEAILAELMEIADAGPAREKQCASFGTALELLGKGQEDPGLKAARAVLDVIRRSRQDAHRTR